MEAIRIKLSALWVSLMLTYFLGDVLRIFSGDFVAGEMGGMAVSEALYLVSAIVLTIPIAMLFLSLTLPRRANRWANIAFAAFLFLFNIVGLPTYPSIYDKYLIIVGLVFNGLTVWYAWRWSGEAE